MENEQRLFMRHFGELVGKKLLKIDLWNEAQNTEILFWARAKGATCYGIDIAHTTALKALSRSQMLNLSVEITTADAAGIPFLDNSFDCVYTMGTLEHLPNPAKALAEISRVLKPGGLAIIGVPNKKDPFLFHLASKILQKLDLYPYGLERWYSNNDLCSQVAESGLQVMCRDGILFLPWTVRFLDLYFWLNYRWACVLTRALTYPFRLLTRLSKLTETYGYLTVAVARKP